MSQRLKDMKAALKVIKEKDNEDEEDDEIRQLKIIIPSLQPGYLKSNLEKKLEALITQSTVAARSREDQDMIRQLQAPILTAKGTFKITLQQQLDELLKKPSCMSSNKQKRQRKVKPLDIVALSSSPLLGDKLVPQMLPAVTESAPAKAVRPELPPAHEERSTYDTAIPSIPFISGFPSLSSNYLSL